MGKYFFEKDRCQIDWSRVKINKGMTNIPLSREEWDRQVQAITDKQKAAEQSRK